MGIARHTLTKVLTSYRPAACRPHIEERLFIEKWLFIEGTEFDAVPGGLDNRDYKTWQLSFGVWAAVNQSFIESKVLMGYLEV